MYRQFMPAALVALLLTGCVSSPDTSSTTQVPQRLSSDPRAAQLQADNPSHILFWSREQQLAGYPNIDKLFPTRPVRAGTDPYPLRYQPDGPDLLAVTYQVDGTTYRIRDYVERLGTTGLMVLQRNRVLFEHYSLGHTPQARWKLFSVGKSVTSLLVGAAIADGYIASVNDPITDYLPRLKGSNYDGATIANVLNMASGVAWNEDYADPDSDVSRAGGLSGLSLLNYLRELPAGPVPGTRFNYSTGETHLVGLLLRAAIGNNAATYLQHKIWQPFGMASDANWMLDAPGGGELGGCCLSATLPDLARLGLFVLADGVLRDGTRVLPEGWIQASTSPSAAFDGYGYLWWLRDGGAFQGVGIFGQALFLDPSLDLVIAQHGAWPAAVNAEQRAHQRAALAALRDAVRDL